MTTIKQIWAREILDSRSVPTVEAACQLSTGHVAVASVPSGSSKGVHEALELRDQDQARYLGQGVLKAVENVNNVLGPALVGMDPADQKGADNKLVALDATETKTKYGANAILSVSVAVAKAASMVSGLSLHSWLYELAKQVGLQTKERLPTPLFNMINGGLHGAGNLDFQEFFVIPATSKPFSEALRSGVEIYHVLGATLDQRGAIHSVGDEGGYAPNLFTNADALEIIVEAINQTNYSMGRDVFLGLDIASSTFFEKGEYTIRDKSTPMNESAMIDYYKSLNEEYHLAVLEDPLEQDSWEGWKKLTQTLGSSITIIGDDLLVTQAKRVQKAISEKACNAVIVKPNQVGTVWETLGVVKLARDAGWKVIVSHRSGETNDWFIADFSVAVGAEYVKFGAPARGERVVKFNRLSAIELEIGNTR